MKYTRQQIENAICSWTKYLLESKLATSKEVQEVIGEGLFKRAMTGTKNLFKKAGHKVVSGVKAVGKAIHDTFKANKGVKMLLDAIKNLRFGEDQYDPDDIFFKVFDGNKTYRVVKFVLSKNKQALVALYDEKQSPCATYEQLNKVLKDAKVAVKGRKISDFVDALLIGKIEDDKSLSESYELDEADRLARIDDVIEAMKWARETAMRKENVKKLISLLGLKDADFNAVRERIKTHFSTSGSDDSSDTDASSDSSSSSSSDGSSSSSSSDAYFDDSGKDKALGSNNYLIDTTDGQVVGVKDNEFKTVQVKKNYIGIIFQKSNKERKQDADMKASLG